MTPVLLVFDTATEHLSIALDVRGDVLVHEAPGGAQASATLIPAILALLGRAGTALREVDAIAFGRGPGAFTGLRTACSVAQGLAFGAAKPVLPIDTLLAVAEDARGSEVRADLKEDNREDTRADIPAAARAPSDTRADARADDRVRRVWVAMDARMHEVYAAQYAFAAGHWSVVDAPMLTTPAALEARWRVQPPEAIAGNALTVFADRLATFGACLWPEALPRARAMLPLAHAAWAAGGALDAALALPLYLRDKVAQTTAERDAAKAAKHSTAHAAAHATGPAK